MKDLKTINPLETGMLGDLLTPMVQTSAGDGFATAIVNRLKLGYLGKTAELKADIARYNCDAVKSLMQTMESVMLYPQKIKLLEKQIENAKQLSDFSVLKEQEVVKQEMFKTKTMEIEFKTAELTYKQMLKEVEDDSAPQDREK